MEREDKIRSGVDERLLHLVIDDGSTVSEHVQTFDRNEQAEFAELRTAGRFVIRPSDEIESQPRGSRSSGVGLNELLDCVRALLHKGSRRRYVC